MNSSPKWQKCLWTKESYSLWILKSCFHCFTLSPTYFSHQRNFLGFNSYTLFSWVMRLTPIMYSANIVSACLNFFRHLCSAKTLLVKRSLQAGECVGRKGKTHTCTHFEMKNKPKHNLCWIVMGSATDTALQSFSPVEICQWFTLNGRLLHPIWKKGLLSSS